jgi:hypothetical protein
MSTHGSSSSDVNSGNDNTNLTSSGPEQLPFSFLCKFIKPFSGNRDELQGFISDCNRAFSLTTADQAPILLSFIISQISGKAKTACLNHDFQDWDELKSFLKEHFQDAKHHSQLLFELFSISQNSNESITNFIERLETSIKHAKSSVAQNNKNPDHLSGKIAMIDEFALTRLIYFSVPTISSLLRLRGPVTLNEAISYAISEEKAQKLGQTNFKNSNGFNHATRKPCIPKKESFNVDKKTNIFCKYCKKSGHVISECRTLKHKNDAKREQPCSSSSINVLSLTTDSMKFVTVTCPQTSAGKLSLLVDTGAGTSLVGIDSLDPRQKLIYRSGKISLTGISKSHPITTVGYAILQLKFNSHTLKHKFYVVNRECNLPKEGILGLDFLSKHNANIDFSTRSLFIQGTKFPFDKDEVEPDNQYLLQPRCETVVEVNIINPEIQEGVIPNNYQISKGVYLSNAITKVRDNGKAIATILNANEVPINVNNICVQLEVLPKTEHVNYASSSLETSNVPNLGSLLDLNHLNFEERESILNICSDFPHLFHSKGQQLSCTAKVQHEINTGNSQPVCAKTYRYPQVHKAEVNSQILDLLAQGIIQPSSSPWSSPLWVVPKKPDSDGSPRWRVVIDYRKLNDVTVGDSFPIPNVVDILDQLSHAKYFSTLDLASGFHQIKVHPRDQPKTAFSTPTGHYEFTRMPFGLKNAPSTFQRLMNNVLTGLQGTQCFVYLDDIVIYASSLRDHELKLRNIFKRLSESNLKLQLNKCQFLRKEVLYLGHIISEQGVKPNPEKVKAIVEFPVPKNDKEVKSFLGLVGYYRRFIQNFSVITKPLTSLLKKDIKFSWTVTQQEALESLKRLLCSEPLLIYPDYSKEFILTTDASNFAIGAILSQGPIGSDQPIAYASRALNSAEGNYSTTEKELLAIVWGTNHFRPYLYGRKFKIVTDHKPLQWLFNVKDPGSRLTRWRLKLEEHEYEIMYKHKEK